MLELPPPGTNLLFAADGTFFSEHFWPGFVAAILYGILGLGLVLLGFKMFDWITPRMDIEKELAEKHNVAVAIVVAAILIGVCILVASVVH
jgi:putative membrane protein